VKPNDNAGARGTVATWALAAAQLISWGSIYYAFSLFVVLMEVGVAFLLDYFGFPAIRVIATWALDEVAHSPSKGCDPFAYLAAKTCSASLWDVKVLDRIGIPFGSLAQHPAGTILSSLIGVIPG
jgi:hypothetical protein